MLNYHHHIPTDIYFGQGVLSQLNNVLKDYGETILVTYGGGSIKKAGLYDAVMRQLKENHFQVVELSGIEPNPRITSVEEGVRLCKANHVDAILAIGGGSVIDCSKAIAAGYYYPGDDLWQMVLDAKQEAPALPLVAILTIAATGSEFDNGGVISNLETHEKLGGTFTFPKASFCDPTLTFTVSPYQTASGSVDIMSHIIEGYFSRTDDSDLADGIAETVLKSTMKNCLIALKEPNNYSARANLMANSSIACSGIPEYGKASTGWPCHGMEHELSAYYDITHGVGLAILTPRWMRYILTKDPSSIQRFKRFAINVIDLKGEGDDLTLAQKGIDALESFFNKLNIPMSLKELQIDETHFKDMAHHCLLKRDLTKAFVPLDEEDIVKIYQACL